MSQENVEVVLGANAAANGGDYAQAAAAWHPDAELRDQAHAVDSDELQIAAGRAAQCWIRIPDGYREWNSEPVVDHQD